MKSLEPVIETRIDPKALLNPNFHKGNEVFMFSYLPSEDSQ